MPGLYQNRKFFLCAVLFFVSHLSFSQKLTFCESVDAGGNPKNASTAFTVSQHGGFVNLLVTLPHEVNSTFVTYDLFLVSDDNVETFENTIRLNDVRRDYVWFSKEIIFHKAGAYNVYVYDNKDRLLCAGRVTIKLSVTN
jgi:hypothetical protein